jgi:hypothetical protein
MRRLISTAVVLVMASAAMLSLATSASANQIAGGGYSSTYAGESIFTNVGPGQSGQFSAIFFNDGTQTWLPGVVGLLVCASDKTTCNIPNNSTYAHNWYSATVYATVTTAVAPGQNGFFIYNFDVPPTTGAGVSTTFNGDVGLIATGAVLRPEGYYQVNTTPTQNLSVVPSPASIQVGSTQQFTVSGLSAGIPVTWSVSGGCGAITAAGLFAATSMNSATQPCTVVASVPGGTGVAVVSVFGSPSSLGCTATPMTIVANGGLTGGTAVARVSLKDPNGNIVSNASLPQVNIANVTPGLATMTPTGLQTPIGGVVQVNIATTTAPGDIQLSASAVGLTGCNVIITSTGPGNAAKTIATFSLNPIASDAVSTSALTVDVTDVNGNRVISDNVTQITITRDANSSFICQITGVLTGTNASGGGGTYIATAVGGRVAFTIQSTTTPGQCTFFVVTNNTSIAGTSASMTTQIVGAANRLSVLSNDQPHPAQGTGACTVAGPNTDQSCTIIVVGVQDGNGALITSDNGRTINAGFDSGTCSSAGGGSPSVSQQTNTSSGKATFAIRSPGAYSACVITFSFSGLASAQTTAAWTAGGADHLACTFTPNPIAADGASQSSGLVTVRDAAGNAVNVGTYGVSFSRTGGSGVTILLTGNQNTSNGSATFTVKSSGMGSIGTDTYAPALTSGSLPHSPTSCNISAI